MEKVINYFNKLSLPATILIASTILGCFYFATQIIKQRSIEKQQQIELLAKKDQAEAEILKAQKRQESEDLLKQQEREEAASLKQQQQTKVDLQQKQRADAEAVMNKCITDAYTELKTLQGNFDAVYFHSCAVSPGATGCDSDWNKKSKAEAFATYQNEWIPQCKLGNRVFIHYEPYTF